MWTGWPVSSRLRAAQRSTNGIATSASSQTDREDAEPGLRQRACGRNRPPVFSSTSSNKTPLSRGCGSDMDDHRVNQQELEQKRDVADDLDIDRGQGRDQPVVRQSGDAHREADDRRQDDADDRHQDGVEEADEEGAAEGAGGL